MPWGFAAVATGIVASSVISGDAAQSAASTQANAANNASATQLAMFDQTQQNLSPYLRAGTDALGVLGNQLGLGPNGTGVPGSNSPLALPAYGSSVNGLAMPAYGQTINGLGNPANYNASMYQQSPGYQFQLSQGLGAISNAASAQGGIQSGNTLKALTAYGEGVANQDYQQAYQNYLNNYNNTYNSAATNYADAYTSASANANTAFNRLQTIAGSGQNAAANLGSLGSQTASQVGSNIIGAGNARAAGTVGAANAATGGINSLSQLAFLYQQNPNLFAGIGSGSTGGSGVIGGGGYTFDNGYMAGYGGG